MNLKNKLKSTVNHIKSHPVAYAYAAGAVIGITTTSIVTYYITKDLKLVNLNDALKRIHDEGLTGLKYEMNDAETLVLIPMLTDNLTQ